MILVTMTRNPSVITDDMTGKISRALPNFVALALDAPDEEGGGLDPCDVEVRVREPGRFDQNYLDLQIEIKANRIQSRVANLNHRAGKIISYLLEFGILPDDFVGKDKAFVRISLGDVCFRTF